MKQAIKYVERIGHLYKKAEYGKELVYAQYIDYDGKTQRDRLVYYKYCPPEATGAIGLFRVYDDPSRFPDLIGLYGSKYDN